MTGGGRGKLLGDPSGFLSARFPKDGEGSYQGRGEGLRAWGMSEH